MNPKVDFFFRKANKWQKEQEQLRQIALDCGMTEELKWGCPCYTYEGTNVVLIHAFRDYCAYLFFKGVLLKDTKGILIQQTKSVQAARQIRFTSSAEIAKMEKTLKAYIYEAAEVEKAGLKVVLKKTSEYEMPAEFKKHLKADAKLNAAFKALTPGRQRAYLLHFSSAKLTKTREARIEKNLPRILQGKGIDD